MDQSGTFERSIGSIGSIRYCKLHHQPQREREGKREWLRNWNRHHSIMIWYPLLSWKWRKRFHKTHHAWKKRNRGMLAILSTQSWDKQAKIYVVNVEDGIEASLTSRELWLNLPATPSLVAVGNERNLILLGGKRKKLIKNYESLNGPHNSCMWDRFGITIVLKCFPWLWKADEGN